MTTLPVYYTLDGTPFTAAAVPLPSSPYASPAQTPQHSPHGSPYGVHLVPLPAAPAGSSQYAAIPIVGHQPQLTPPRQHIRLSPVHNPIPLPPVAVHTPPSNASIAVGTKFRPHPLLEFDAENPRIQWDVRLAPSTIRLTKAPNRHLEKYFDESAIEPPWTFMRLRCSLLNWEVECSNPRGVTVGDVILGLWDCLREQIERDEWAEAGKDFREKVIDAFETRTKVIGDLEGRVMRIKENKEGPKKVDWLLWDFQWLGIKRSSEVETWELFFRSG